ncbi:MAG TPA: FadR/GntR family transcriptional regulator [Hyphomicrobiales bacterium]|jgi:DNA-binding FadR family transcriptional regulator
MPKEPLLTPLESSRSRAEEVVARISREIEDGRLSPGAKLPTEQAMASAMGVSRTVVREAVAALKADGLVITRQGAGAFVAAGTQRPFRIDPAGLVSLDDVIGIMELRMAIEVEAAAFAAHRAGRAQIRELEDMLQAIDAAIDKGEGAVNEDFALHRAIAAAAQNRHFADFLTFLGHHIIPRQTVRMATQEADSQRAYLGAIQEEHRRIVEAIQRHDVSAARKAMRRHLNRSLQRYRKLGRSAPAARESRLG